MKVASDQQHLLAIKRHGPTGEFDLYKAAISVSNTGAVFSEEEKLTADERHLLKVRRLIFARDYKRACSLLLTLEPTKSLLKADVEFLKGQILHKTGKQQEASAHMLKAAELYRQSDEPFRELRARANGAICVSSLESCLMGELFTLEQEARREGFHEIAANICRMRAIELITAGLLNEAYTQAMAAADLYLLDGYPDDRAVAIVLGSIALWMKGESERALEVYGTCLIKSGKVTDYISVFEALRQGRAPKVSKGHSLWRVKWSKFALKGQSVPGKILQGIRQGYSTRDKLIAYVWGENALDVSYSNRLHSALNYLKKSKGICISYDGENYQIV